MGVALAGAVCGVLAVLVLVDYPSMPLLAGTSALGAVLVTALWRAMGFEG
jgi:hypothetical protein